MIGRLSIVVLDCPEPQALARFYAELLGFTVTRDDGHWVQISDGKQTLAFQRATDYVAPQWPDSTHPQQFHLDIDVDDIDEAHARVVELGARRLPMAEEKGNWRVYADPVGHPFCLVW